MTPRRGGVLGGLLLLALGLAVWFLPGGLSLTRPHTGRQGGAALVGSSYERGARGCSELYDLLGRAGGRTERWIRPLTQLAPGGSLVIFSPAATLDPEEQRQLVLHAEAGGTVLLVTDHLPPLLAERGLILRKVPLPAASHPLVPSPLVDPTTPLESRGMALLAPRPGALALYGSTHGARVASVGLGTGRFLLITDPFILDNEGIRRDGNLRFAWRLAHALPSPIRFDEHHHGFEPPHGVLSWARFRGLTPTLAVGMAVLLLALWRAWLRPRGGLPTARAAPAGPAGLVEPLAARLREAHAFLPSLSLLEAELRRRGQPVPQRPPADAGATALEAHLVEIAQALARVAGREAPALHPRSHHGSPPPPAAR
ncbi:MAG: DUF4350 domain-containing protein [Pseudomonadota bacterium]